MYRINENQSLSVGYSRKMTRPSFYDLNPFQLYVNKYLYTEGNPFLLPVRRNVTEVAYTYRNINATLAYQLDKDPFQQLPVQDVATGVLHYTRVNLDLFRALTLDLSASHALKKWWKIQQSVSVFYNQTKSAYLGGLIDNRLVSYYLHGQQIFTLVDGLTFNLDYEYASPTASQIYRSMNYGTLSVGLQKSVMQGLGNVQINIGDVFNTYRESFYGQYQNIDLSVRQKRNVQQGSIRFSYNFGKSTYKQKAKTSGSAEEESRAR
jgi:outer membrane receptor protein involved in Fe transport